MPVEVKDGRSLIFVEVGRRNSQYSGSDEPLAMMTLATSMLHSGHLYGLLCRIELDAEGRYTGAARAPLPLVRMGG